MRPSEIDYSSRAKHYLDIANGEVLAGAVERKQYVETLDDRSIVIPVSELLELAPSETRRLQLEKLDTSAWPRERYIEFGRWIIRQTAQKDSTHKRLNRNVLRNARWLGIAPGRVELLTVFDSYPDFYRNVRSPSSHMTGVFDDLSLEDLVAHLKSVGGNRRPTIQQVEAVHIADPTKPGIWIYRHRFEHVGGFSKALEQAGFPVITLMDETDYKSWGARFMRANGGLVPSAMAMDYLSGEKHGPSSNAASTKFGSLRNFQSEVMKEYAKAEYQRASVRREVLGRIRSENDAGRLPAYLFITDPVNLAESELVLRYSKFRILQSVAPSLSDEKRSLIVLGGEMRRDFVARVKRDVRVSAREIEYIAFTLGFFDEIWPAEDYLENLKLGADYEAYAAKKKSDRSARDRQRKLERVA